jgi:predicted metal-dependent hydrolase
MELRDIPYDVSFRDVKYPRLEFTTGRLLIVLPLNSKPETIWDKHKVWVEKKMHFINDCLNHAVDRQLINREDDKFKKLIYVNTKKAESEFKVKFNSIYFRKMKTKWASLSSRKSLTINTLMRYLPDYLIKYVVYHEAAHLIEKRHNGRYWELIEKRFKNYQKMEREMFLYWFKIKKGSKKKSVVGKHKIGVMSTHYTI